MQLRRDVTKRIQNEITLRYPGMRQRQLVGRKPAIPVREQIEIDFSRAPSNPRLGAAELPLDGSERTKKIEW